MHVIAWGLILVFHGAFPIEFNNDDPNNDTSFKTFQACNDAVKATTEAHPELTVDAARCYPIIGKTVTRKRR